MKFLCICNHGNCRSYALARILKYSGHEAINVGWMYTSIETLALLTDWADYVIFLGENELANLRKYASNKYTWVNIGPDRWGNPFKKELEDILIDFTEKFFSDRNLNIKINEHLIRTNYG